MQQAQTAGNTNVQPVNRNAYFYCDNLHAYYGESYIVQGVSFDIN